MALGLQVKDGELVAVGTALKVAEMDGDPCCCDCDSCPPCPWTEIPITITLRINDPATNAGPPPPCVDELCDATAGNARDYVLTESGSGLSISGTSGCVSSGTSTFTLASGLDDDVEACDPELPGDSDSLERLSIDEIDPPVDCAYSADLGGCGGDPWDILRSYTQAWHQTLLQITVYIYCAEEENIYGLAPGPYLAYQVLITQEFFAKGTEVTTPPDGCGESGDTCHIDGTLAYGHSFFTWHAGTSTTLHFVPGCAANKNVTIPLFRAGDGSGSCDKTPDYDAELILAW